MILMAYNDKKLKSSPQNRSKSPNSTPSKEYLFGLKRVELTARFGNHFMNSMDEKELREFEKMTPEEQGQEYIYFYRNEMLNIKEVPYSYQDFDIEMQSDQDKDGNPVFYLQTISDPSVGIFPQTLSPSLSSPDAVKKWWKKNAYHALKKLDYSDKEIYPGRFM
jgi:hypothetical protein